MNFGIKRYHAPENEQGSGEGDNFDDLAPLGKDGGEQEQDSVEERGSRLDKLLDEHLQESDRGTRQAPKAKEGEEGTDNKQQRQPNKQGQGTNQDERTQERGQGTRQPEQTRQDARPPRNVGSLFRANGDGSIYDLQGRKVANPGLERRVFDRVSRYYNGLETEHAGYKQRIDAYESANAAAKAAGLSIEENALGLRVMTAWKRSPVETINFLLTQARNQGHDVSSIQQGGAAFDPAAVGALLEEKLTAKFEQLQPLIEQLQHAREMNTVREQVSNEITAFFEENPEAAPHRPVLGALMQHMDTGDPRLAWAELRVSAAQNGWDLSKPLGPQAQATKQRQNGAPTRDGNSRTVPDMTGRGGGGTGDGRVPAGSLGAASKDDSWDDIVESSLGFRP
jgi:hypothetical protein